MITFINDLKVACFVTIGIMFIALITSCADKSNYYGVPEPTPVVGPTGATGAIGPPGIQGPVGQTGQQGSQGIQGVAGTNGTNGINGINGSDGTSCSVVQVVGGANIVCGVSVVFIANGTNGLNGTNGTNGVDGSNGSNGKDGTNGTDGINGTNGTIITPVQFCTNQGITVYPSNFPEYGLCLSGTLYAVYWDQANMNAWFAQIVPGTYISTATGLQCTFTVGLNCSITH